MVRPCRSSCARRRVSPDGGACTGRDVLSFARLRLRHDTRSRTRRRPTAPPPCACSACPAARSATTGSRSRSRSSCASSGAPVAVTMRTPGHDEELALGFALSEGLRPLSARVPDDLAANTIELEAPGFDPDRLARSFYTTSSCGVCGKGALEAVAVESPPVESTLTIPAALLATAARPAPRGAGRLRLDRRAARDRPLHAGRRARVRARGRRPPQRDGQGDRTAPSSTVSCRFATTSSA